MCYELRMATWSEVPAMRTEKLANGSDIEGLYGHLDSGEFQRLPGSGIPAA